MFCGNCGKEISGKGGVCEYCGTPCRGSGSIQEDKKSLLPARFPGLGKKKKIIAAAAVIVCVVTAAAVFTVPRLLVSPKQKVLLGAAKTIKAGINGDTTLVGILGLDEMMSNIRKGSTAQVLKMSYPEEGEGVRIQILSDQKKGLSRVAIAPTVGGMDLAELMFYKKENLLHFGLPDVLDDLYYVDLANLREEYSGSALDRLILEETGMDLKDALPADLTAREADSYLKYCQEELNLLYDDMEVKKDGTEAVRVDGKSQKCDRYHVMISGSSIKDLLSASLNYLEDGQGAYVFAAECLMGEYGVIRRLRKEILPQFKFRDLDMTVCLDKKGRLVSVKGEWTVTAEGESAKLEYEGAFTGGSSPLDKVRGTLLISLDSEECEFTFERDKEFQKKSSLRDQMELTVVYTWGNYTYTYPYSYEFSYNPENGKWDFTLANMDSGYHMEGMGRISDVKKGKELSVTVDEFIDLWGGCYEGSYELTSLEKEGIEPPEGLEKSISLFDMSKAELLRAGEDLEDWADSRLSERSSYGGTDAVTQTTAAPADTTAAAD